MARKKEDGVFLDANGIYWAYFNGKKRTPNRQAADWKDARPALLAMANDVLLKVRDER